MRLQEEKIHDGQLGQHQQTSFDPQCVFTPAEIVLFHGRSPALDLNSAQPQDGADLQNGFFLRFLVHFHPARSRGPDQDMIIVIVKKGDKIAGLVIDELIGQQEIVIKSLGKYIKQCKFISGATILGDGEVALILDANALL